MRLLFFLILIGPLAFAQTNNTQIDSLLRGYATLNKFNGTALVIQNGKRIYEKSFGYQDATSKKLNSKNSIYQIASLTKPFTALVILKLCEKNKISIHDPLSKFVPNYPKGDEITIQHLLTHTSGISDIYRNPKSFELEKGNEAIDNDKKISLFKDLPLDFTPGSKFSYSNSGYILLGIIIEKVTGMSYGKAVQDYIFNPLKMKNSGFNFTTLSNQNKTVGYSYLSPTRQITAQICNPFVSFSSGGLYSSADDLQKFYEALLDHKLLSEKSFEKATTPFLGGYGYGWFIDTIQDDRVINHGGNIEGSTSYFLMMPEKKICIILLNNITSTSLERIGNSIYSILSGKPFTVPQPKKELQLDEETMNSYVGRYEVSENDIITISKEGNSLFMTINNGDRKKMLADKKDSFFFNDDPTEVRFAMNKEGLTLKIRQGLSTKTADKVH